MGRGNHYSDVVRWPEKLQHWLVRASAASLLLLLAPGAAEAQTLSLSEPTTVSESAPDPLATQSIRARLAQVEKEKVEAEQALAGAEDPELRAHLSTVADRLREIEAEVRQQLIERQESADPSLAVARDTTAKPSVFALNQLLEARYDDERGERQRKQRLEASRSALVAAKEALADAAKSRRAAKSALEAEPGLLAQRKLELRRLGERLAQEVVYLRTIQTREAERDPADASSSDLTARIEEMRRVLASGAGDDTHGFAELSRREGEMLRERAEIERQLASAELVLEAARQRFSRGPDTDGDKLATAEARAAARDAIRQRLVLVDAGIERAKDSETIWRQWSAALAGQATRQEIESWMEAAADQLETLSLESAQREGRLEDLQRIRDTVREQLAETPDGTALESARRDQLAAVEALLEAEREEHSARAAERRLTDRFLQDLEDLTGHVDVREVIGDGLEAVAEFWSYEIASVEDSSITVGSLIIALLMAGVGFWGSRRFSAFVGGVARRRFKLDSGASHALETLAFYVLFVSFTLLVLRIIHFPLTVFTVLGGALAIGVGFGSQNVMNNFISGLILMFERPIRAGDLVEVEGNYGTVEAIGARSTRIRSTDGRHIIVPNSFFLENNVVNWTLSDELVRAKVLVGVIYGSPTRLVEQRIRQAVDEDREVLKHPEPVIIFEEFGDNSLNFEVHFWVRARAPMAMKKVQSRIRFRIDDLFREDDLVIAFPQRDVHLDSAAPLQVEFVGQRRDGGGK